MALEGPVADPVARDRVAWGFNRNRGDVLAKPNYGFEKRQRELAKKKKQDEKDARKREARAAAAGQAPDAEAPPAPAPEPTAEPAAPEPRVHLRPSHGENGGS